MPNFDGIDIFTSSPRGEKMYANRVVLSLCTLNIMLDQRPHDHALDF